MAYKMQQREIAPGRRAAPRYNPRHQFRALSSFIAMPLFDHKPVPTAHIAQSGTTPLSKDQKTFNSLINKIEAGRARLSEWEAALPDFRRQYASDLLPLATQCLELQSQLVRALDAAHGGKGVTKGEKRKLAELITDLAEMVLMQQDDEEIKDIFNKYSESDYDDEEAANLEGMKAMFKSVLGVDLGDDVDMSSPHEVLQRVESQFLEQQEAHAAKEATRKKSPKEEARLARQEAEEKQLSQSVREVFRKLASALHPDRELDPEEKTRKTALMQRANEAYKNGNLLQLLELQLELEHIDQAHLVAIRPERLKHYIKILKGQLNDLNLEIERLEDEIKFDFDLSPFDSLHPKALLPMLRKDVRDCLEQIAELREQLATAADPKQLKLWLKTIARPRQTYPDFDMPF
ncbi:MAG TPA: molecular chaperone DnaJ [Burkholderiaceae bacterium]